MKCTRLCVCGLLVVQGGVGREGGREWEKEKNVGSLGSSRSRETGRDKSECRQIE